MVCAPSQLRSTWSLCTTARGRWRSRYDEGVRKDVGSATAVVIGLFVAGLGQLLFLVGAIGKGVHYGVSAVEKRTL